MLKADVRKVLNADLLFSTLSANAQHICVGHSFSISSVHFRTTPSCSCHHCYGHLQGEDSQTVAALPTESAVWIAACTFRACALLSVNVPNPQPAHVMPNQVACSFAQPKRYAVMSLTVVEMPTAKLLACSATMLTVCTGILGLHTMFANNV